MTARILPFRRPLSPVPEHIERKDEDWRESARDLIRVRPGPEKYVLTGIGDDLDNPGA